MERHAIWSGDVDSLRSGSGKVPRKSTELKRCMVIERRCSKKQVCRLSPGPVNVVSLRPRSRRKFWPVTLIGPKVSIARGTMTSTCVFKRALYLAFFLSVAINKSFYYKNKHYA